MTVDAALVLSWIAEIVTAVSSERDHLTALDAAIGDADHGVNLDRGFTAVQTRIAEAAPATPGAALALAGRTLISTVGGASGPLYGTALREMGKSLGDADAVDDATFVAAIRAGLDGVRRLGAAAEGDKTMVDAFAPALAALQEAVRAGQPLATAAKSAAHAADDGARATAAVVFALFDLGVLWLRRLAVRSAAGHAGVRPFAGTDAVGRAGPTG